jgi:streptogramin lyase
MAHIVMKNVWRRTVTLAATLALLAGCAGSNGMTPSAQTPGVPAGTSARELAKGKLVVRISIPKKHDRKHHGHRDKPRYISYATQAMTIALSGPTNISEIVSLQPTATGCSSTLANTLCTLTIPNLSPCPTTSNCYTAIMATYDGVSGCPNACTIPTGANELSANQDVAFNIAKGESNAVNVVLDGIPASVEILPVGTSSLSGNMTSGFSISRCATTDAVSVLGVDADGNYILGPGAPTPSLSSSASTLTVATPAPGTPNRFRLTIPAIPNPNSVANLTASVKPGSGSGTPTVQSSPIPVEFTGSGPCGHITEYSTPTANSSPTFITEGPDGAMWFSELNGENIGRITTTGSITEYPIGTKPYGIATGSDGALWFAEPYVGAIGHLTTSGTIAAYTLPVNDYPLGVAQGADGAMWVTEDEGGTIARIPVGGSPITEYTTPTNTLLENITPGPDGALWFTECEAGNVGKITTAGAITEYPVGNNISPLGIAVGGDGALWFTNVGPGSFPSSTSWQSTNGRVTTTGVVSSYSYSITSSSSAIPHLITEGADGSLWFAVDASPSVIVRMTTTGTTTTYPLSAIDEPWGIAAGPNGTIWFTDNTTGAIGEIQ